MSAEDRCSRNIHRWAHPTPQAINNDCVDCGKNELDARGPVTYRHYHAYEPFGDGVYSRCECGVTRVTDRSEVSA